MALIGNNADTLLNGLSDFWHRFFRDIKDIQATYEGTEILLGQVYLNLLSDVLNTSLVEAPLFRKEYYKLITIREDQIVYREHGQDIPVAAPPTFYGNPGTDRYVLTSDTFYGGIPRMQDVIYAPKTALESGVDYVVVGGEIQYKADPTDPILPGYASRKVTIGIGGRFSSTAIPNWIATGVKKGDTLLFSESTNLGITASNDDLARARKATIVHVGSTFLSVSVDTPMPTFPVGIIPTGFSWRVQRKKDDGTFNTTLPMAGLATAPFASTLGLVDYATSLEVSEISFWAVDSKVDDLTIYKTYGYFFTDARLSTETYRSLIRGLMQLYILGPALARLESALNLTAGLPTIREEGEILQSYDSGILAAGVTGEFIGGDVFQVPISLFNPTSLGSYIWVTGADSANNIGTFNIIKYLSPTQVVLKPTSFFSTNTNVVWKLTKLNAQTVTTDQNTYLFPLDTPIRTDVKDPLNFFVLPFQAFETITTAIQVTDYIQDPEWWHTITIPQEILPELAGGRRVVTPQLYSNTIGPIGNGEIGDPGFYVGASEVGENPITGDPILVVTPKAYHYNIAFMLMDRFLKAHMFAVLVDQSVRLTGLLVDDLQKILQDVKPVHTLLYFRPLTTFRDIVDLIDYALVIKPIARMTQEQIQIINNDFIIGSPWLIGNTWAFAGASGGALTLNPMVGGMYATIGGADPSIQPINPGNIPPGVPTPDLRWIDRPVHVYMHP